METDVFSTIPGFVWAVIALKVIAVVLINAVKASAGERTTKRSAWLKEPVAASNIWPGVVLGYRRTDGQIHTGHARDDWDLEDLDSWAADNSALPDVAEAWVSWTTPNGRFRQYWVNGERTGAEKAC